MSAMDKARQAFIDRREGESGIDPRNEEDSLLAYYNGLATYALAEEQRTANLIAYLAWLTDLRDGETLSSDAASSVSTMSLAIAARLGLSDPR